MDITETISLLDELKSKATQGEWNPITEITGRIWTGYKGSADSLSVLTDSDSEYIIALHNSYEALRQAALDGERYKRAGEELANGLKEMDTVRTEIFRNFFTETDWRIERDRLLQTYRQAVEQKEV